MGLTQLEMERMKELREQQGKRKAKELRQEAIEIEKRNKKVTPMAAADVKEIDDYIDNRTYRNQKGKTVKLLVNEYTGVKPEDYKGLNPWIKGDSLNLTEQGRITSSNNELARYLKEEALKDGKWHGDYEVDMNAEVAKKGRRFGGK